MSSQIHAAVPRVFSHEVAIVAEDLSPSGHVNNVSYLRFVEEARIAFLGHVPPGGTQYAAGLLQVLGDRAVLLVGQHLVEYRAEVWPRGQRLRVDLWIPHLGTSSLVVAAAVHDEGADGPAVVVESTAVLVDREHRRPWPMDPATRQVLGEWPGDRPTFRPRAGSTARRS